MNSQSESPERSDRFLFLMMDAVASTIGFEPNDLRVIEMQMRHNTFEVSATDAATEMLKIKPPMNYSQNLIAIENAVDRLRRGEKLDCKDAFPAGTLGVLWGWQIVSEFNWKWRAVAHDWWETLGVCDPNNQYVILPVQYMRGIAEDEGPVAKWPREYIEDIRANRLPAPAVGKLLRIC